MDQFINALSVLNAFGLHFSKHEMVGRLDGCIHECFICFECLCNILEYIYFFVVAEIHK